MLQAPPYPELDLLDPDTATIASASRLEMFARTPYLYFVKYVLEAEPLDEPALDDEDWLDALTRGTILHRTYELFLNPEDGGLGRMPTLDDEQVLWDAFETAFEEATQQRGTPPNDQVKAAAREALKTDVRAFLRADAARGADQPDLTPERFEWSFGNRPRDEHDSVELDTEMRNAASLSTQDQLKLAKSGIAIIGAGGLGGHIAAAAARTGIGRITIADPDAFAESNLNRQAMCFSETLGRNKAEAAKSILTAINPAVEVRAFTVAMDRQNAGEILEGADAAADALDSVAARRTLAAACRQAGIPLVHAAIAGFEGQIMTVFPRDPGIEALYGKPDQQSPSDPAPEAMMGVPGVTPALMATLQVMEIIKIVLGRGRVLRNRMLYVDLENAGFQEFSFNSEPDPS
ncbi:MAG: ThiF family adenylyltransferase [Desulfosalsimonas sp.]|uniref:HesA/MoeB/ThiF family protein n=1 Tax=Desulfosalsimonas sp. TaxID=3073848 RepID=UPI00397077CE